MDYKVVLGIVTSIIGFIGFAPYLRDVFRGLTKPHPFSWFLWGTMEAIAFFAQIAKGAGPGAWVTGSSAVIVFVIAFAGLKNKDKQIRPTDWIALTGAVLGIVLWQITNNPLLAVISVTLADAFAFIPTFHKSYHRPQEETLFEYAISSLKWTLSIFALGSYSLTTWLYPASLIITNGLFVIMALVRRRQVRASNASLS